MVVYCSTHNYLLKEHPDFADCARDACISPDDYPLVIIPPKKDITAIAKALNTDDPVKYRETKMKLLSYFVHAKPRSEDFKEKPEGVNGLRQRVRFSGLKDNQFVMHSGKDFTTLATCKYVNDFTPALSAAKNREGESMHKYVATLDKGEISLDGISRNDSVPDNVAKLMGGAYVAYETGKDVDKKSKFEELLKSWHHAIDSDSKKNPFVSAIAGLICCIKKGLENQQSEHYEHYHRACQLVKSLGTYDALGMYLVLFQPFGPHQFIPQMFTSREWDGAEKAADSGSEYCDLFECVDNLCSCDCCKKISSRDAAIRDMDEMFDDKERASGIMGVYEKYIPQMFGDDFLDCKQKLWADELSFRLHSSFKYGCKGSTKDLKHSIEKMVDLAKNMFPGKNYKSESLFSKPEYWSTASIDSITGSTGSNAFIKSEFFLKCCFTSSPECKDYVSCCSNPISTKTRTYFAINGGSIGAQPM